MPFDPKRDERQNYERSSSEPIRIDNKHSLQPSGFSASFQPRLIHPEPPPEDSEGDLDLPDDLSALADQLQDDATHLANRYPAEASSLLADSIADTAAGSVLGATAGSSSSVRLSGATAGSSSSVPVGNALRGVPSPAAPAKTSPSNPRRHRALIATAAASLALALGLALINNLQTGPQQEQANHTETKVESPATSQIEPSQQPRSSEVDQSESLLLLGEASAPEREGLLDLWQKTASNRTSISF
jgi:hypothetical protein